MTHAFDFVPLDPRRSLVKPRGTGITMVKEYETGLAELRSLLATSGDHIDIMEMVAGTARLFRR